MTLLQSCLIDVLKPEKDVYSYYDIFLSSYSIITVTAIVSQCMLLPGTYGDMTKEHLDGDIDEMIFGLPQDANNIRDAYPILTICSFLNPGKTVQETESRIFASELFAENAKLHSLSNRELVIKGLNASAFLNYFFLIEDTLKTIYIKTVNSENKFIKGSSTISLCLNGILSKEEIKGDFEKELKARSKFFFDIKSLELIWSMLNTIRNQMAHANGFYDDKAKLAYKKKMADFGRYFDGKDEYLVSILMIMEILRNYEKQIDSTNYLIVDDSLENIIRNISVFIMESLYVCNKIKKNNTV